MEAICFNRIKEISDAIKVIVMNRNNDFLDRYTANLMLNDLKIDLENLVLAIDSELE